MTRPTKSSGNVYECAGMLYRVDGSDRARLECLIGSEWRPSHLTLEALRSLGARTLADAEALVVLRRVDAR